ncbi:VOC family protein [Methanolobus sp.]|uniref:VOC family protein n=1 Tax=Methanolobus sp. TaxID=1874737 RepID=UPI0025D85EB7|nr:VOC family protein [Methanolobus sp.]
MNRIVHFEIQADDPERTAKFYGESFGWDMEEWVIPGIKVEDENRYWLVTTGPDSEPGINGGMAFRRGPAPTEGQPVNSYVCTIGVENLDESADKVLKAGGSITVPKMAITGVGWLAYCKDTEGNIFGIMQDDETAQ